MREVYVAGVGMTKFGRSEFKSQLELFGEAAMDAINESNLKPKDIQALFLGNAQGPADEGITVEGQHACAEIGLGYIPAIRLEGACSSGTAAIVNGFMWIASGYADIVLAAGTERNSASSTENATRLMNTGPHHRYEGPTGITFPGVFGLVAHNYSKAYNIPMDELKEVMCKIAQKHHHNATFNPRAQFQKELTREKYYASAMVADPLQLFDCCPMSDGSAAMVLCSKEVAQKLTDKPVQIAGIGQASAGGLITQKDYTRPIARETSAKMAYKMAGITPKDLDVVELHDCFTIAEIVAIENLGIAEYGKGWEFEGKEETALTGSMPVNPSGGLKAKGHPVGATGVAQGFEIVNQIRGKCEAGRQLEDVKIGLTDTMGGPLAAVANVIYKRGW